MVFLAAMEQDHPEYPGAMPVPYSVYQLRVPAKSQFRPSQSGWFEAFTDWFSVPVDMITRLMDTL
jgi:hypothetical protein